MFLQATAALGKQCLNGRSAKKATLATKATKFTVHRIIGFGATFSKCY